MDVTRTTFISEILWYLMVLTNQITLLTDATHVASSNYMNRAAQLQIQMFSSLGTFIDSGFSVNHRRLDLNLPINIIDSPSFRILEKISNK